MNRKEKIMTRISHAKVTKIVCLLCSLWKRKNVNGKNAELASISQLAPFLVRSSDDIRHEMLWWCRVIVHWGWQVKWKRMRCVSLSSVLTDWLTWTRWETTCSIGHAHSFARRSESDTQRRWKGKRKSRQHEENEGKEKMREKRWSECVLWTVVMPLQKTWGHVRMCTPRNVDADAAPATMTLISAVVPWHFLTWLLLLLLKRVDDDAVDYEALILLTFCITFLIKPPQLTR